MKKVIRKKKSLDKEIVPLVKRLNRNGLKTIYSCSGHENRDKAYITFDGYLSRQQRDKAERIMNTKEVTWKKNYNKGKYSTRDMTSAYFTMPEK